MESDIVKRIEQLKKKHNAVILVHNYQPEEVQEIADILGDSLELSRKAAATEAAVILFCGVHFMAETAAILAAGKAVLIPEPSAGCPMADMITVEKVRAMKQAYPGVPVVCYVNSSAAVKAESDICCTSANAVGVVNSLPGSEIIFIPDKYLGQYVADRTGKKVILSDGYCPVHAGILPGHIVRLKREHPCAVVLVHPECPPQTTAVADQILSTTGMCHYVKESTAKEFIIGTETGILFRMRRENPDKKFYPVISTAVCPNMKKNSLAMVLNALETRNHRVTVEENIRGKALSVIEKMIAHNRSN